MFANVLWCAQDLLHGKSNAALPASLLTVAGVMVVYRHMTQEHDGSDPVKTFLAFIMLQMLPLVLIEVKILHFDDPVGLLCRFGPKVLLMHACFLLLRVCSNFAFAECNAYEVAALLAALITLHFGFKHQWSCRSLWECRSVWCLAGLATAAAFVTKEFEAYFVHDKSVYYATTTEAANYIEILSFVPAVWAMYGSSKVTYPIESNEVDRQRQAASFFAFLVAFYFMEDVVSAVSMATVFPLAACGHIVHFLLLLDLAVFLLARVYNPQKLKDCLQNWFPEAFV